MEPKKRQTPSPNTDFGNKRLITRIHLVPPFLVLTLALTPVLTPLPTHPLHQPLQSPYLIPSNPPPFNRTPIPHIHASPLQHSPRLALHVLLPLSRRLGRFRRLPTRRQRRGREIRLQPLQLRPKRRKLREGEGGVCRYGASGRLRAGRGSRNRDLGEGLDAQVLGSRRMCEEGEGAVAVAVYDGFLVLAGRGVLGLWGRRWGREEAAEAGEGGLVAGFLGEQRGVEFLCFLQLAAELLEGLGGGCCGVWSWYGEVLGRVSLRS